MSAFVQLVGKKILKTNDVERTWQSLENGSLTIDWNEEMNKINVKKAVWEIRIVIFEKLAASISFSKKSNLQQFLNKLHSGVLTISWMEILENVQKDLAKNSLAPIKMQYESSKLDVSNIIRAY